MMVVVLLSLLLDTLLNLPSCATDVMVEFMMSHMMKKLPIELFLLNVGITHRLLCYQKRNSVRLPYNWKDLWAALIALAKFLVTNEAYLAKKMNIFQLANQVSLGSLFF